ncbi:MAG: hypothetical protein EPO11_08910 [Gammaproteobacteria bacterium]|nr:MAG: hypothetical protein EPO11_08910 [Gammaproteobacteria bacterium]
MSCYHTIKRGLIILWGSFISFTAMGATPSLYDQHPWSVLYYYGFTVNNSLLQVLSLQDLDRWPEHIQSVEVAHTLSEDNFLRRLVNPIVGVVQLAGNVTVRDGDNEHTIYEFDPYVIFRWANLPWNQYVNTSFAFAEGVSYATSVPAIEKDDNDNTKRFLNYLMFEATFALPSYPQLQLAARVHHRSGAYGLYHAGNSGSNDIGIGISYLFD